MTTSTTLSTTPINNLELKEFVDYCLSYYGEGEMYSHFFDTPVTEEKIVAYTFIHINHLIEDGREFEGDTLDREAVRDLMVGKTDITNWMIKHEVELSTGEAKFIPLNPDYERQEVKEIYKKYGW
tara:strand:+ start:173 stop:547 length:375 start_codon:yes stop_codon:yes gene_type:complete